jgi:hypothetical protein
MLFYFAFGVFEQISWSSDGELFHIFKLVNPSENP